MLRIATVEDDANDLEALRTHLSRYEKENGLKFQVTEFRDGEDIVTDYSADYDLILMDIEMAFLNGMKAAEKIRELDKDVIIIFITNMPQYAIQGYKVNALDYMLKPISYFSFSESMGRALHRVNVQEKEFITIALKGGKKKLDIAENFIKEFFGLSKEIASNDILQEAAKRGIKRNTLLSAKKKLGITSGKSKLDDGTSF